jgi:hypothetical protein
MYIVLSNQHFVKLVLKKIKKVLIRRKRHLSINKGENTEGVLPRLCNV